MRIALEIDAVGIPQTIGEVNQLNASLKKLEKIRLNPGIFKQIVAEIKEASAVSQKLESHLQKLEQTANRLEKLNLDRFHIDTTNLKEAQAAFNGIKAELADLGKGAKSFQSIAQASDKAVKSVREARAVIPTLGTFLREVDRHAEKTGSTIATLKGLFEKLGAIDLDPKTNLSEVQQFIALVKEAQKILASLDKGGSKEITAIGKAAETAIKQIEKFPQLLQTLYNALTKIKQQASEASPEIQKVGQLVNQLGKQKFSLDAKSLDNFAKIAKDAQTILTNLAKTKGVSAIASEAQKAASGLIALAKSFTPLETIKRKLIESAEAGNKLVNIVNKISKLTVDVSELNQFAKTVDRIQKLLGDLGKGKATGIKQFIEMAVSGVKQLQTFSKALAKVALDIDNLAVISVRGYQDLQKFITIAKALGNLKIAPDAASLTEFNKIIKDVSRTLKSLGSEKGVEKIKESFTVLKKLGDLKIAPDISKINAFNNSLEKTVKLLKELTKVKGFSGIGQQAQKAAKQTTKALSDLEKAQARSQREAKAASTAYLGIAKALGTTFKSATELVRGLGLTSRQTQIAVKRTQEMKAAGASNVQVYRALQLEIGITAKQYQKLNGAVKTANAHKQAAIDAQNAAKAQQQLQQKIKRAEQEVKTANDAYLKLSGSLGVSVQAAEVFTRKLGLTGAETSKLVARLQKYQKAGVTTAEAAKRIANETGIAKGKIVELGNALEAANKKSKTGGLTSFFKGLAPQIAIADAAVQSLQALGRAVRKFVGDAIQEYAQLEQYLAEFHAIGGGTGETEEELEVLKDKIQELGATTQKSTNEIGSIVPSLKRAGLGVQETTNFLEPLTKAAIATGESMADLQDGTLAAANYFGKTGDLKGYEEAVNGIAKAADSTRTSYVEMTDGLKNAGGAFKQLNISQKDQLFIMQNFAEAGQKGAQGGTAARNAALNLSTAFNVLSGRIEPTNEKMRAQARSLEQLGISSDEAKQLIENNDWEGIWRRVNAGLTRLNGTGKDTQITMELFGNKMASKVGGALLNSTERMDDFSESAQNTEGYVDKVAETMSDTLQGAIGRFVNGIGDLKQIIGETLNPLLRGITEIGAQFLNLINGALRQGINQFTAFIKPVSEAWHNFLTDIASPLQEYLNVAKKFWENLFEGMGPAMEELSQAFGDRAEAIFDIVSGLADAFSEVYQIVEPLTSVLGYLTGKVLGVGISVAAKSVQAMTIPFKAIEFVVNKIVDGLTFVRVQMAKLRGEEIADPFEEAASALEKTKQAFNENKKALDELRQKSAESPLKLDAKGVKKQKEAIENELKELREIQKELRETDVVGGQNRKNEDDLRKDIKERIKTLREAKKELKDAEVNLKVNPDSIEDVENTELDPLELEIEPQLEEDKIKAAIDKIDLEELDAKINLEERIAQNPTLSEEDIALEEIKIRQETVNKKLALEQEGTKEYKQLILEKFDLEREAEEAATAIREKELENRLSAMDVAIAETEALLAAGEISEIEGEKRITKEKQNQLKARIEAVREALAIEQELGRGDGDRAKELIREERELQAALKQESAEAQDRLDAAAKRQLDKQLEERNRDLETQIAKERQLVASGEIDKRESEKRITKLKKDELEQRVKDYEKALEREKKAGVSDDRLAELAKETEQAKAELAEFLVEAATAELNARIQERTQALENELAKERQMLAENEISKREFDRRTTKLRKDELEQRVKDYEEALRRERASGVSDDRASELVAETEKAKAELAELIRADNEREYQEDKKQLEKQLQESTDLILDAEAKRQLKLSQMRAKDTSENQINQERLEGVSKRIQAEIKLEREKIAELEKLEAVSPEQAEEKERAIREAKRKTVELTAQLTDNQVALEENARAVIIEGIKEQARVIRESAEDAVKAKQDEITANELLNQSYQRQKALLDSKASLLKAQSQLSQTQSQIEIDNLNRAIQIQRELASGQIEDAKVEKALKQELASLGVKGGKDELDLIKKRQQAEQELLKEKQAQSAAEFEQRQQALEIEVLQNQLQQERLILQAEEAQLQAELNRLKAEESLRIAREQKDEKAIEIAQKQLEIADKEIALSQRRLENARAENIAQDEILSQKKQQLEIDRQSEKEREASDRKKLTDKQNLERAKAGGSPNLSNQPRSQRDNHNDSTLSRTHPEKSPQSFTYTLPKELLTARIFPQINVPQGENFSDEKMVNELQGVGKKLDTLIGVTANQKFNINNNYKTVNNTRSSDYGKAAINSANL